LSPALRARRQVVAALQDLQRLAAGHWSPPEEVWEIRLYDRMIGLPPSATLLQRGQLVTALGVGLAILPLRQLAGSSPAGVANSSIYRSRPNSGVSRWPGGGRF
jgi:hypothetical protein